MSFQAQQSKISILKFLRTWFNTSRLRFTFWPVVEYCLGDVPRRIAGAKQELFRLPADQDQPQVDLQTKTLIQQRHNQRSHIHVIYNIRDTKQE
jgi:hypothetical protein